MFSKNVPSSKSRSKNKNHIISFHFFYFFVTRRNEFPGKEPPPSKLRIWNQYSINISAINQCSFSHGIIAHTDRLLGANIKPHFPSPRKLHFRWKKGEQEEHLRLSKHYCPRHFSPSSFPAFFREIRTSPFSAWLLIVR